MKITIPTNYSQARNILGYRTEKTIPSIRGTKLVSYPEGVIGLQYHGTTVARFLPNGKTVLQTGGYRSVTTKRRLNQVLGSYASVFQRKGVWYLGYTGTNVNIPFQDGMIVNKLEAFV